MSYKPISVGTGAIPIVIRKGTQISDVADFFKQIKPSPPTYDPNIAKLFSLIKDLGINKLDIKIDGANGRVCMDVSLTSGDSVNLCGSPFGGSLVRVFGSGGVFCWGGFSPVGGWGVLYLVSVVGLSLVGGLVVGLLGGEAPKTPLPVGGVTALEVMKPFDFVAKRLRGKVGAIAVMVGSETATLIPK